MFGSEAATTTTCMKEYLSTFDLLGGRTVKDLDLRNLTLLQFDELLYSEDSMVQM